MTSLPALIAAITALAAAISGLVGVVRHITGPAHRTPPAPPRHTATQAAPAAADPYASTPAPEKP